MCVITPRPIALQNRPRKTVCLWELPCALRRRAVFANWRCRRDTWDSTRRHFSEFANRDLLSIADSLCPDRSAAASAAALAAIQAKMPVVIGQQTSTPCCFASAARISLMVINFPFGTRRMMASTSSGAGTTMVPVPQRFVMRPVMRPVFGKPLLSASFSRKIFE